MDVLQQTFPEAFTRENVDRGERGRWPRSRTALCGGNDCCMISNSPAFAVRVRYLLSKRESRPCLSCIILSDSDIRSFAALDCIGMLVLAHLIDLGASFLPTFVLPLSRGCTDNRHLAFLFISTIVPDHIMDTLPPEILHNILAPGNHTNKEWYLELRMVCSSFRDIITPHAFANLCITDDECSLDRLSAIAERKNLSPLVRSYTFHFKEPHCIAGFPPFPFVLPT